MIRPFIYDGIARGRDGVARYEKLQPSLVHAFREAAEANWENEAVVELGAGRVSYREFWDAASHVAGGLRAQDIQRGDRVAIRLPNGIPWCIAFFGIQLAGAVAVPVNTRFSEQEVEYVINDSGSKYVRSCPPVPCLTARPLQRKTSARKISPRSSTRPAPRAFRRVR